MRSGKYLCLGFWKANPSHIIHEQHLKTYSQSTEFLTDGIVLCKDELGDPRSFACLQALSFFWRGFDGLFATNNRMVLFLLVFNSYLLQKKRCKKIILQPFSVRFFLQTDVFFW